MKLITSILAVIILLSACNNGAIKDTHASESVADSQVKKVYNSGIKDTTTRIKHDHHGDTTDDSPGGDIASNFNEYVARYKNPCLIDSVFNIGPDTFKLHLKHYCLMDSAIDVPEKYVYMYKLDSFVTHNFATIVRIEKNNRTILQRTVYKKDFEKFLYPQLKEYGALFCPSMNLLHDTIELDYSISIPLTDVGVGVTMIIKSDGTIAYENH
jgi:hypothetical protein